MFSDDDDCAGRVAERAVVGCRSAIPKIRVGPLIAGTKPRSGDCTTSRFDSATERSSGFPTENQISCSTIEGKIMTNEFTPDPPKTRPEPDPLDPAAPLSEDSGTASYMSQVAEPSDLPPVSQVAEPSGFPPVPPAQRNRS